MFVTGKDEDATDCLKSIMAIYLFRHEIKSQAEKQKKESTSETNLWYLRSMLTPGRNFTSERIITMCSKELVVV